MLNLDGTHGGGQLIRSALTCSMLTGSGFTMKGIRGARETPGLRPQHVAAVDLSRQLCDAIVDGCQIGSTELTFQPHALQSGSYATDIESAGSIPLVFDTVVPISAILKEPTWVTVTGGTDVKWAPTIDYFRSVKLPMIARFGFDGTVSVHQRGFYPIGNGKATLTVSPGHLQENSFESRGGMTDISCYSIATVDLEARKVAERQVEAVQNHLGELDYDVDEVTVKYVQSASTGSVLTLVVRYGSTSTGFSSLGEPGKPAERVGTEAAKQFIQFDRGTNPVDSYFLDQLLIPLAIAGGAVVADKLTNHARTNLQLLQAFGLDIQSRKLGDGRFRVQASRFSNLEEEYRE